MSIGTSRDPRRVFWRFTRILGIKIGIFGTTHGRLEGRPNFFGKKGFKIDRGEEFVTFQVLYASSTCS